MTWKMAVLVKDPLISEVIQKLAEKAGYKGYDGTILATRRWGAHSSLFFNDINKIAWSTETTAKDSQYKDILVSIENAIKFLQTPKVKPIKVGEYEVEVAKDKMSLQIGCQKVTKEQVDAIYKKLFA